MAEQHDLSNPETFPSLTAYKIDRILIDVGIVGGNKAVRIDVVGDNGPVDKADKVYVVYQGAEADALMKQINKANFSTDSMQKQLLQKLETDGWLPVGSVSGVPD